MLTLPRGRRTRNKKSSNTQAEGDPYKFHASDDEGPVAAAKTETNKRVKRANGDDDDDIDDSDDGNNDDDDIDGGASGLEEPRLRLRQFGCGSRRTPRTGHSSSASKKGIRIVEQAMAQFKVDCQAIDHNIMDDGSDAGRLMTARAPGTGTTKCGCENEGTACDLYSGCLNRHAQEECNVDNCGIFARQGQLVCGNRAPFLLSADPEIFEAGKAGLGLRQSESSSVEQGAFVAEYVGIVFEAKTRPQGRHYVMEVESGLFIDAQTKGGLARFINHSNSPNCEVQTWRSAKGSLKIFIFTNRDVCAGEEFCIKYGAHFEKSW